MDYADACESIRQQLYRYCRSVDRLDVPLGQAVWHIDGTADYGPMFRGSGAEFIVWVCAQHRRMLAHSHQVTSVLIEIEGDRATSEAYVTAALRFAESDRLFQIDVRGRYLDRWSNRAGRWAIDHRVYVHDFDDKREVTATQIEGWSRRDGDDPSYALAFDRA